jgi:hypothetical protein
LLSRLWLRTRALFEEQFGDLETTYVLMAVGLGRMNNAPVDISTIAAITGISRLPCAARFWHCKSKVL